MKYATGQEPQIDDVVQSADGTTFTVMGIMEPRVFGGLSSEFIHLCSLVKRGAK